jgi:phage-related protein
LNPVHWVKSSKSDLRGFPSDVVRDVGYALLQAQNGEVNIHATPLIGFKGAGVLEKNYHLYGNKYRAVYTTHLSEAVFVLHCFQKKSKSGIATPPKDMDLVKSRLKLAEADNERLKKAKGVSPMESQDEKPSG